MQRLSLLLTLLFLAGPLWAGGTRYEMRIDGLACPFCAYGVEKKLKAIEGTRNIEVDLDRGIVKVDVTEGRELTEVQMRQLFHDAGFTYRSMKQRPIVENGR
jgi:mercuric ion binding protein